MKLYVKGDSDIWYTDKSGRERHDWLNIEDSNSVYRILRDAAGEDFADAFKEQLDSFLYDNNHAFEVLDDDFNDLNSISDDIATEVTAMRSKFNDLAERIGSDDEKVKTLLGVMEDHFDEIEGFLSILSGTIYGCRVDFGFEE